MCFILICKDTLFLVCNVLKVESKKDRSFLNSPLLFYLSCDFFDSL